MVWIPGSNNGTFGAGMSRGAVFPAQPGYFYKGFPLPQLIQHPTGVMDKPYLGRAFGRKYGTVYELTPGGVTTEAGWGFTNKHFGRRRKSRRGSKRRRSRRSRRGSKKRRSRRSRRGSME
jgi:hypothetical protein